MIRNVDLERSAPRFCGLRSAAEMSRVLGLSLPAAKTARFFASAAHTCDAVTFPGPRPDAMDGAVEIQRRGFVGRVGGIRDNGSRGTFCCFLKMANDQAGTPD